MTQGRPWRAQVKEEGYEVEHGGYCITVFSAPNYCDQMCGPVRPLRHSCPLSALVLARHVASSTVLP